MRTNASMSISLVISIAWLLSGCGDVCQEAIEKWNSCMSNPAVGQPAKIGYVGECTDGVTFKTASGNKTVALRSWSERYTSCTPEPITCLCPGLPSLTDYSP